MKRKLFIFAVVGVLFVKNAFWPIEVSAARLKEQKTNIKLEVNASGAYRNWDGVSNVAQFTDEAGEFAFAYDKGKYVYVVKTKGGVPSKKSVKLKKYANLFGGVECDSDGNLYVVTGKVNTGEDTEKNTIFISKYNSSGELLATVGDNGSSSLAYYYGDRFYTKYPFDGGNCDVSVNGDYVAVNYAREMYSGHQSNSLLVVDRNTMKKLNVGEYYNSHSFAQRIVPYGDDFLLASEGDCYNRAFTISVADVSNKACQSSDIFDFWVQKGAFDRYDMYVINNNFAHMGGIAVGEDAKAALVATSVKSLNSNAEKEPENLFIQIFDPTKDLSLPSAYVTSGERSGLAGKNGDESVSNYGVKWLTNIGSTDEISNPQVIATDTGNYVILYQYEKKYKYQGTYMMVLDGNGKKLSKAQLLSKTAKLNSCEMPAYSNGKVYWVSSPNGKLSIYSVAVD